ncbi:MAG: exodeoxyribonuclease VII large subunit, partial [Algisphaera sp.]
LHDQVDQLARRLVLSLTRRHEVATHRLEAVAGHMLFRRPEAWLGEGRATVNALAMRLDAAPARRVADARRRVDALARTLEAVGPQQVLARGYSYTVGADGKLLRSAAHAKPGDAIKTVLADGEVKSTVNGGKGATPRKPRRMKTMNKPGTDEPMLFA